MWPKNCKVAKIYRSFLQATSHKYVDEFIVTEDFIVTDDFIVTGVVKNLHQSHLYRPQRSWGKVKFSQASVILSIGWGVPAPEGVLAPGGVCSHGGGAWSREGA